MGCGETLFLGEGGHVTCSWDECPDPGAANELLNRDLTSARLFVDLKRRHVWDGVREIPTTLERNHESLFRSWHVLQKAREMLERGDSTVTVLAFVKWAYMEPADGV